MSSLHSTTRRVPGLVVVEHTLDVPLDHADVTGEHISLFARELRSADKADDPLPYLLYLQGGPGFEATRVTSPSSVGWVEQALREFRVVLLDQRGTGRSTPVGTGDVARHGPDGLAARLVHHRADSIVIDAERLRRALGVEQWAVLGQSFGGFCTVAYLSMHPESLSLALVAGGLPPLDRSIDDVYRATYARTVTKCEQHYTRFPEDRLRAARLVEHLAQHDVRLPSGDRLTPLRFRQLGILLGSGDGSARLHHILELPVDSPGFLHDVASVPGFERNPLYAVVHESCYANGETTDWAAARMLPDDFVADETLLTGEHVYPWMFAESCGLAPFADTAELLAGHAWPRLYDAERLADNDVPCAAAVYADDMYVEREFSEQTANDIKGMRVWLTNQFEHDGLRASGSTVFNRLLALARGRE